MTEFFNMGGYAFFVWTSYGIVALVLLGNVIAAHLREKQIKQEISMKLEQQDSASTS